jgi:hypothetical protein
MDDGWVRGNRNVRVLAVQCVVARVGLFQYWSVLSTSTRSWEAAAKSLTSSVLSLSTFILLTSLIPCEDFRIRAKGFGDYPIRCSRTRPAKLIVQVSTAAWTLTLSALHPSSNISMRSTSKKTKQGIPSNDVAVKDWWNQF